MLRFAFALAALAPFAFCQTLPSFNWDERIDNTGLDSLAGIGTDSQGNTYVAGSTLSPNFPVKSAVQSNLASAGLYVITGPGSAYTRVGANWVISSLAVDPINPNVLFGVSSGSGIKSVDGGNTWSALAIPSTTIKGFTVDPSNDQNIYAATFDIGVLKSTDGGVTWTTIDNGLIQCTDCGITGSALGAQQIWIDPNFPNVIFVFYGNSLARSANGGASWVTVGPSGDGYQLYFDTTNPGVIYVVTVHDGSFKSTDDGQTFQPVSIPVFSVFADPNQAGRLLGTGEPPGGGFFIFESTDDGATWAQRLPVPLPLVAADWANGVLYAADVGPSGIFEISTNLTTVTPVGPPNAIGQGFAVADGRAYVPLGAGSNVFVTKLDPSGNVVYSTYFGGSGNDLARAMAVDSAGSVYVTGTTTSQDFPATKGAYSSSRSVSLPVSNFLFKLNSNGTVSYSTYFPAGQSTPLAIAVDGAGSAYVAGVTNGGLPTTPGAYQTVCGCGYSGGIGNVFTIIYTDGFITKFDPAASMLVYSTYLGVTNAAGQFLALASDGSAYLAGAGNGFGSVSTPDGDNSVYHISAMGSSLLASVASAIYIEAMALGPDGSLYLAGNPVGNHFQPATGAFQTSTVVLPTLPEQGNGEPPSAILKMDSTLQNVLAASYFGGPYYLFLGALAFDAAGNVYAGGSTAPYGLPTRTPFVEAFGPAAGTGFLSELSGDLSSLLFSSYLGNTLHFGVGGVAMGSSGSVIIAGSTGVAPAPGLIVLNSLGLTGPPPLRIDSIQNAASLLDGPISAGETIIVNGAGFGSDSQLSIGNATVPIISLSATQIVAAVPANLSGTQALVQVQSGGATSNEVKVPVASASPGIFSANGAGYGQGYILNQDGTLNAPSNPASPGDRITIYATGAGTESPVNVLINGLSATAVGAVFGPVAGFPGSVDQITVVVPSPSYYFPSQVGVIIQVAGATSQNGLSISVLP